MGRKTLAETLEVKQVGVEVELLKDSQSDVVADTQETPKTLAEKPEVKQVGVEVEFLKDSHSDVVADTHETPETHAVGEEPGLSFKTQKAIQFQSEVSGRW